MQPAGVLLAGHAGEREWDVHGYENALADGMITRIVAPEQVEDEALAIARKLAAGPTLALQLIRDQAWAALDNSFNEQLSLEREYQRTASRTEDFREGVEAFHATRKPEWKGL